VSKQVITTMQLSPLHVEVDNDLQGVDVFHTRVGEKGRTYPMDFTYLMRFISLRQGAEQKRLEFRK
jgi:hypothetical protein